MRLNSLPRFANVTFLLIMCIPYVFVSASTGNVAITSLEKRNFYACQVKKGNLHNPIKEDGFIYGSGGFIDFFADGKLEFYTNGDNYYERAQGTENFIYPKGDLDASPIESLSMVWLRKVVVADINNDGLDDAYLIAHGWDYPPFPGEKNKILLSSPDGYVVVDDNFGNGFWHSGSMADFNNDGRLDILATTGGIGINMYALQRQDGSFAKREFFGFESKRTKQVVASETFDADDDGNIDLLISSNFGSELRIYWGNGKGDFKEKSTLPVAAPFNHIVDINYADTDGDGVKEIVLLATTGSTSNFYKGYTLYLVSVDGRKLLDAKPIATNPNKNWIPFIYVCDTNGDGKDELFSFETTRDLNWNITGEPPFGYPSIEVVAEKMPEKYIGKSCRYTIRKKFYDDDLGRIIMYEVNKGKLTITSEGISFLKNEWLVGGIKLDAGYMNENANLVVTSEGLITGSFPVFGGKKKKKTTLVSLDGTTFSVMEGSEAPSGTHEAYRKGGTEIFELQVRTCR